MRRSRANGLVAVSCAMLAVGACSSSPRPATGASPLPPGVGQMGDAAAMARARADSARLPYTKADIHFMSGMIGHHAQAIRISRWVPTHGGSESIRTLSERIINAQQDEIHLMQTWLRDRNQPAPQPGATGTMMMMDGMEHKMTMPGMLTDAHLKELDGARGEAFDVIFLRFMIQHHQGAVEMVKELFATPRAGQDELVFKFASDVNVDQTTEIARMQRMLFDAMLKQHSQ